MTEQEKLCRKEINNFKQMIGMQMEMWTDIAKLQMAHFSQLKKEGFDKEEALRVVMSTDYLGIHSKQGE